MIDDIIQPVDASTRTRMPSLYQLLVRVTTFLVDSIPTTDAFLGTTYHSYYSPIALTPPLARHLNLEACPFLSENSGLRADILCRNGRVLDVSCNRLFIHDGQSV